MMALPLLFQLGPGCCHTSLRLLLLDLLTLIATSCVIMCLIMETLAVSMSAVLSAHILQTGAHFFTNHPRINVVFLVLIRTFISFRLLPFKRPWVIHQYRCHFFFLLFLARSFLRSTLISAVNYTATIFPNESDLIFNIYLSTSILLCLTNYCTLIIWIV